MSETDITLGPDLISSSALGIKWELFRQFLYLTSDLLQNSRVSAVVERLGNPAPHRLHIGFLHATRG